MLNLRSFHCLCLAAALWPPMFAADSAPTYFRSDGGVASTVEPLPGHLDPKANLSWRTPLDSGHSTPIAVAGKILVTSFNPAVRELATVALDEQTGRVLWKAAVPTTRIEEFHPQSGNAAMATPASDGQRVFVLFGSYGLLCYDLEGKLVWERPLGPFQDEYGSGSSPTLLDDKLIVQEDHDIDSFLMAVDRYTGRTIWRTARPQAVRSYSTPIVWQQNGRKQIIAAGALEVAGYDAGSGEKLWWINGLARIVIPMPVPVGNMIYMASWAPGADAGQRISLESWQQALAKWDKNKDGKLAKSEIDDKEVLTRFYRMDLDQNGQLDQPEWDRHAQVFRLAQNSVLALKPEGQGDLTKSAVVWKHPRGVPYVSTPLVHQGIFWMVKDGGLVTKLDAATGRLLQQERLPALGNYFASPVAGDGKVYFVSESGAISVIADEPEWRVISTSNLNEKTYASPLLVHGKVFIRTAKALYCFR